MINRPLALVRHAVRTPALLGVAALVLANFALVNRSAAQLCVQLNGALYKQNFNSLPVSGSSNTSSTIPMGFGFSESGSGNNVTFAAGDGSSATANTYSFGTGTNTDRALGELGGAASGVQSILGGCFVNNTGFVINSFSLGYTGELWRLGAADGDIDRLDFQFSTTATSLNDGDINSPKWTNVNTLDFVTPVNTGAGAKNGNVAPNRTEKGPVAIIPAGGLPFGSTMFIRWVPLDLAAAEDGLAIDDLTFAYDPSPDFDLDGVVDGDDFLRWQRGVGKKTGASISQGDANKDGAVDALDLFFWRSLFAGPPFAALPAAAPIPEPVASALMPMTFAVLTACGRRRRLAPTR